MRWETQEARQEEELRLPGVGDAVVRRFDAPEAMNIRFHEVRTKSALNRIPTSARLPFEWTVNPYRGCTHACVYCHRADTPVLLADGRPRPIADLRVGDEIYGTARDRAYRRYVRTEVRAHWQTLKPAYRVTLEDGRELVASGDHRFLTRRGWKHVTGAMAGPGRRPYLTVNNELLGTGAFAGGPEDTVGYRRGYLCGLIRGDGTLASRPYVRPTGRPWVHHFFRLALADLEALDRARGYVSSLGAVMGEFFFHAAAGAQPEIRTE